MNGLIQSIFAKSPLKPIVKHIKKVHECSEHLVPFFKAVCEDNWDAALKEQQQIKALENEADEIKRKIRIKLPSGLFMPIERTDLLELVSLQDTIANDSKDIAGIVLGRQLKFPSDLQEQFFQYLSRVVEAITVSAKVIGELVRIARKRIMLSVSSRLGSLPYLANPIQKNQFILDEQADDPFVQWCVGNREEMVRGFRFNKQNAEKLLADGLMGGEEEIRQYEQGGAPWCITYTFMPDELESILAGYGVQNIRLSGPGAYGRTIPREILVRIMNDPEQKKDFLDFCYRYDSNRYVCGMGKDNLLAAGEIKAGD